MMRESADWYNGHGEPVVMYFNDCCIDQKGKNDWMRFCPMCGHYIEHMKPIEEIENE